MCIYIVSFKNIISEDAQIQYKRKKKNLFVTKKARFLAKRPIGATGDLANKKYFSSFFYYVIKKY